MHFKSQLQDRALCEDACSLHLFDAASLYLKYTRKPTSKYLGYVYQ